MNNYNGVILVNKPSGIGSTDVVRRLKYLTKSKTGHLGTLDPLATGVLPIAVGNATRLFDILLHKSKTYLATFRVGLLTDTLDITGKVTNTSSIIPTESEVKLAINQMIGDIEQMPPQYSAKKISGTPAYKLARQNIEVQLKPKKITIHNMQLLSYSDVEIDLSITCSSGTYIRSIARDLGDALGSLYTMTALNRTVVGRFDLSDCIDYDDLNEDIVGQNMISIDEAIAEISEINVDEINYTKLKNGLAIDMSVQDGTYKIKYNNVLLGLADIINKIAKLKVYLLI